MTVLMFKVTGIESDEPTPTPIPTSKPSSSGGGSSAKYGISSANKTYDNGSMNISKKKCRIG